jgi:CRP/FNR family transcriptional regulator, cyclic AMP receptor protein
MTVGVNGVAKVLAQFSINCCYTMTEGTPARLTPSRRSARNPKRPSSGLPTHLSRELFAHAEVVRLPAGRVLFWEGDSGDGCYRVEDGLLKLTMVSKSGVERILAFHGPGDIVGELAIIDGLPRPMSAIAVRDAVLKFLSRTEFEAFAEKHPELCQSLLRLFTKRMRERDKMLAATSFLKVKGRIA